MIAVPNGIVGAHIIIAAALYRPTYLNNIVYRFYSIVIVNEICMECCAAKNCTVHIDGWNRIETERKREREKEKNRKVKIISET